MPTYVYRCAKCGEQLEAFQSFADTPLTKHDECGGKLSKVLSAPAIALKGSGFYKTDNRSGSSNGKPREKSKEAASSDSGSSSGSGSSDSGSSGNGESKPKTDSTSTRSSGGSEAKSA
jgi:putative FmdB family regulatory protein